MLDDGLVWYYLALALQNVMDLNKRLDELIELLAEYLQKTDRLQKDGQK